MEVSFRKVEDDRPFTIRREVTLVSFETERLVVSKGQISLAAIPLDDLQWASVNGEIIFEREQWLKKKKKKTSKARSSRY